MTQAIPWFRAVLRCGAVALVLGLLPSLLAQAAPTMTQVLPHTGSTPQHIIQQEAYILTPNPSLAAGQWVAAPNGVTNWMGVFIEAGPIKDCRSGTCVLRPYTSWQGPNTSGFVTSPDTLAAGGSYFYKVHYFGNNHWQGVYCNGVGCQGIATANLGTAALPYAASGAESYPYGVRIGTVTASWHKALINGSWLFWCYSGAMNNIGGAISACTNHSWSVTY